MSRDSGLFGRSVLSCGGRVGPRSIGIAVPAHCVSLYLAFRSSDDTGISAPHLHIRFGPNPGGYANAPSHAPAIRIHTRSLAV